MSREQLAKELGVNQSTIWRIESGKRRPSPELALKIEKAFAGSITHSDLLYPDLQHTKKFKSNNITIFSRLSKYFRR